MDIKEMIAQLLDKHRGQNAEMLVLLGSAAGTIENLLGQVDALKAELRDERHRHDRYVDFELSEAEELRKLKEQLRWIPVTERLPEKFGEYIVAVKDESGDVYSDYADFDLFPQRWRTGLCLGVRDKVTHWMPLPEPPKGE